ncbi:MAG: adenylate/guanylate cyclase domain-containing protein, partial [Chloroflexota bacterium]
MESNLPTGTLTFLFTDLEDSTSLWETHPTAMQAALAQHDQLLLDHIHTQNGQVVKSSGDGVHAVFESPSAAAQAALETQNAFNTISWPDTGPLRVRIGLHTGESHYRDGDYYGPTVNRAARIMSIGHGGQVLLSKTTAHLLEEHLPVDTQLTELGDYKLKGITQRETIYQVNRAGLSADFPPLNAVSQIPNNLPNQFTSFVGREKQIDAIQNLLSDNRLLTLVGVGGAGKTRLMLHTGESLLNNYEDGVWVTELAGITAPEGIVPDVAKVLSVQKVPGSDLQEVLIGFLRRKNLLLMLDNCEHLINASAQLADTILQNCPGITILATSREGLGIMGESIFQVPSLTLPIDNLPALAEAQNYEAIHLFTQRAQAVNNQFELTEETLPAVIQICRRLDGIPLAIELAASRANILSAEEIAARLDDRFQLLTGGSRTAMPRQQTLQALIEWSWNLLNEEEQALLG